MSEERIDIVVNDRIAKTIRPNIQAIGIAAISANNAVQKLNASLSGSNTTGIAKLSAALNSSALAALRQAKATQITLNTNNQAAIAAQRLATATARTTIAQNQATASTLRLSNAQSRATQTSNGLSGALGGLSIAFGIRELAKTADAYTNLTNRLNTVSDSGTQLDRLKEKIFQLAQTTRSDLLSTADAFVRFDKALSATGASQQEALLFTESLNKVLLTSGKTTAEVSSVVTQLGQALTSGKLEGDEFKSLSEALPVEVLDAIAKELGTTRDQLKALSTDGKITAQILRDAFANSATAIDAAFAKMVPTIEQATVVFGNAFTRYIGEADQAIGISRAISSAIIYLAGNFDILGPVVLGLATAITVALIPAVWGLTAALLANPLTWIAIAIGLVVAGVVLLVTKLGGLENAFHTVSKMAMETWDRIKSGGQSLADVMQGVALMIQGVFARAWANIASGFAGLINSISGIAGKIGIDFGDIGGVGAFAEGLHMQAATYEAGSQLAFGNAANNWKKATRAGAPGTSNGGMIERSPSDPLRQETDPTLGGGGDSATKKLTDEQTALKKIYDETIGSLRQIAVDQKALNAAYNEGWLSLDQYNIRMAQLGVEALETKMIMGDATWVDALLAGIAKAVEGYQGLMSGLSESFGSFFTSVTDGFANSIGRAIVYGEDLGAALHEVAKSALSELISGLVKLGIQWLLMNTIGSSLQAAAGAATAAVAGGVAAAWAPAAALASLATGGTNAAPAATALSGTVALSQGLAALGGIGFMSGGYTGAGARNEIAGPVHRGEYVFDAGAVQRIGVDELESIRRGSRNAGSGSSVGSGSAGGMPSVTINNTGTPQDFEIQSITRDEIVMIARDQVRQESPRIIAGELGNPNSRVSKSLGQNTTAGRNRQ